MRAKNILIPAFLSIICIIIFGCSNTRNIKADPPLDNVTLKNMIESQTFTFIPRYVNHMTGRRRDLSSDFDVAVSKDTIISYLPFFGRGYIAHASPTDVDFDFTSTKFTYSATPSNRGWIISIKPTDQTYLRELYFRVFENASASLTVTSLDRSSISYEGYLTQRKSNAKTQK
jgi:hypothetical protein